MEPRIGWGDDEEPVLQELLPVEELQRITGKRDLRRVTSFTAALDAEDNATGDLGRKLPSLVHLKLSGSNVPSLRDLGTSFSHLRVLWLNRCNLSSLAGAGAFSVLEELYVAFNNVDDLAPLTGLATLETLDLEGNQITSFDDIQLLAQCPALTALSLDGNPISDSPSYRRTVATILPSLESLDDEDVAPDRTAATSADDERETISSSRPSFRTHDSADAFEGATVEQLLESVKREAELKREMERLQYTDRDLELREKRLVQDSIKRAAAEEASNRPGSARPGSRGGTARGSTAGRPGTASIRPPTASVTTDLRGQVTPPSAPSTLTHNTTAVYCGNPIRSLRAKKLDDLPSSPGASLITSSSSSLAQCLELEPHETLLQSVSANRHTQKDACTVVDELQNCESLPLSDLAIVDAL